MIYLLYAVLLLVGACVLAVFASTLLFRPRASATPSLLTEEENFDKDGAVSALQQMVRCKTVSNTDPALEDDAEFEKFIALLPELYPNVFKVCKLQRMDDRALLFKWKGREEGEPTVLMAHYDVVPVNEEGWEKPPFDAVLEDGVVWGRGTLDTKVTVNGVLFAAEHLIAQGYTPEKDIYFAFSGGEEVNGKGAVHIVDWFADHHITPAVVLDEGGAVVENVFPGVTVPCGLIGIAEKGYMNVEFRTRSAGGHASAPKPHTPVGVLSRACCRLENKPFPYHITPPVAGMFDTLARHSNFLYRMIFANLWCFAGLLDKICRKNGGELNALMRTTVAFTQMEGSTAANVIPPEARMVANMRLNPAESMVKAAKRLKKTVKDPSVEITVLSGINPSRVSTTECDGWKKITSAVASTWKGCVVAPYLMIQCSDSRHYGRISDRVFRFSAMDLTAAERGTIHGHNERIRVETIHRCVEFYIRLMKQC